MKQQLDDENIRHGDYDDFLFYDAEMLDVLRPQAEEFIFAIGNLLEE